MADFLHVIAGKAFGTDLGGYSSPRPSGSLVSSPGSSSGSRPFSLTSSSVSCSMSVASPTTAHPSVSPLSSVQNCDKTSQLYSDHYGYLLSNND